MSPSLSPVRTAEEIKRDDEKIAAWLRALDVALDVHRLLSDVTSRGGTCVQGGSVSRVINGEHTPEEYALRLWASAHAADGVTLVVLRHDYPQDGYYIRSLNADIAGRRIAWVQRDPEPIYAAPCVVTNANVSWSPAQEREAPAEREQQLAVEALEPYEDDLDDRCEPDSNQTLGLVSS